VTGKPGGSSANTPRRWRPGTGIYVVAPLQASLAALVGEVQSRFDPKLARSAHRFKSYVAGRSRTGVRRALARETTFVEIGPVTAFPRDTFGTLLPFPDLRMGWGLDAHWAAVAREHGWPIGVVDATPIGHTLRPAGDAYPRAAAEAEARAFLDGRPYVRRAEVRTVRAHR